VEVPVLVAGAGPVGLSLACELERHGIRHRIVDAAPERSAVSRATDLRARSLELWDHTGVADAVLAAGVPITGVPLFSGGRKGSAWAPKTARTILQTAWFTASAAGCAPPGRTT
jgi:2-polyprenyl-6-methoxyphenol hydroxylase-like FAD-dependent oxidoreductase